jgi:hypothetical protein
MRVSQKYNPFWSISNTFSVRPGFSVRFVSSESESEPESQFYVTTDGQSASLSCNKTPIWGLGSYFYYCQSVADLLMWGALSDERTGLFLTVDDGPRQRSYSRVQDPWESWPYILLSQIRDFPFRRLLRLAGLWLRCSTPPPHGIFTR